MHLVYESQSEPERDDTGRERDGHDDGNRYCDLGR
jgi:hypothetical protein